MALGAQEVCAEALGAFTGEVSGAMLRDVGCRYVLVGHSERRQLYGEADALVARKFVAAQAQGLVPVLCVGETLEEREAGRTDEVVARQLEAVLAVSGVGVARQGGGRLRAGLGDRHGPHGEPGAGPGRPRLDPRARWRRSDATIAGFRADPVRRQRQGVNAGSCSRWRTWTADSSAARRSRRKNSRRSARPRADIRSRVLT